MEIRDFALNLLEAPSLEGKLAPPPSNLSDDCPGPPLRVRGPIRPKNLTHDPACKVKVPRNEGMVDPAQRVRILHALANHELQAAELFAWALLLFPEMPPAFRRGCLGILAEEQRHCSLYADRLLAHDSAFGAFPVTMLFWRRAERIQTPLEFICTMGLTFENANLDFGQEHAAAARQAGDEETAQAIDQVHADEVGHVGFAWHWFQKLKPAGLSDWDAYCANVARPLGPDRARGSTFDELSRIAAGVSPEFIARLSEVHPTKTGGAPR